MTGQYKRYALLPEVSRAPGSGFSAIAQKHGQTDIATSILNRPKGLVTLFNIIKIVYVFVIHI